METMETIILKNLIQNEDYTRRVVPFLDEEYFKDRNERILRSPLAKTGAIISIREWARRREENRKGRDEGRIPCLKEKQ